jgi:hypothetical protein
MRDTKPAKNKATGEQQAGRKRKGELSKDVQARIGSQLRAMHDDIVREGVPDRFVELLSRLDNSGKNG